MPNVPPATSPILVNPSAHQLEKAFLDRGPIGICLSYYPTIEILVVKLCTVDQWERDRKYQSLYMLIRDTTWIIPSCLTVVWLWAGGAGNGIVVVVDALVGYIENPCLSSALSLSLSLPPSLMYFVCEDYKHTSTHRALGKLQTTDGLGVQRHLILSSEVKPANTASRGEMDMLVGTAHSQTADLIVMSQIHSTNLIVTSQINSTDLI